MNLFPKLDKKEKSWARMDGPGQSDFLERHIKIKSYQPF